MLGSYHIELKFLHLDKKPEIILKLEEIFMSDLVDPQDTIITDVKLIRSDIGNLKNFFVEIKTYKKEVYLLILDLTKEYKKNTRNLIINGLN